MRKPSTVKQLATYIGAASIALIAHLPQTVAQTTSPGFAVRDISGEPAKPLPIKIEVPGDVARGGQPLRENSFIMLRGLPQELTVSAGFRVRNAWVISFADLDQLQLVTPADYNGGFTLEVLLYWGRDVPPLMRRVNVDVRSRSDRLQTAAPANINPPMPTDPGATGSTKANPPPPPLSVAEETNLLSRGEKAMQLGQVAAARMIYENLAGRGSARAAFAMGQSFDPEVLMTMNILGLTPDVEQARQWYRRAANLGSDKAMERLSAFTGARK